MSSKVLILALTFALVCTLAAQSPVPVIVPAMTPATTTKAPAATTETDNSLPAALKLLQEMKAANDEILAKQAATLTQLDEMEKAAQQIRIYSKRG
ncbi:MAG: hypothetical protein QOD12_3167 [Verrucomicrobiota bacterium]|jgi:hypothetical protein